MRPAASTSVGRTQSDDGARCDVCGVAVAGWLAGWLAGG